MVTIAFKNLLTKSSILATLFKRNMLTLIFREFKNRQIHQLILSCSVLLMLCLTKAELYAQTPPSIGDAHPVSTDYKLVWSDEFEGTGAINADNWHHQTQLPDGGNWFNNEVQHYTNRTDNSSVADGVLSITAKREEFTDQGVTKSFTSARLNSKYAFTYGRVDVRAKLPASLGTWPAIWMLGREINEPGNFWHDTYGTTNWPQVGEIDIMEQKGTSAADKESIIGTVHTGANSGGASIGGSISLTNEDTEFKTYSIIWTEEEIQFLVDGNNYFTYNPETNAATSATGRTAATWPFDSPQYLLLNIAMGGDLGGAIPAGFQQDAMEIDYVRVYQQDQLLVANAPTDAPSTPPTRAAEDVISIYGEAYGTEIGLTNVTWDDPSQFTEETIAGNKVLNIDLSNGFIGSTLGSVVDATSMTNFHMDFWIADDWEAGQIFNPKWSDHAGGNGETSALELTRAIGDTEVRKWVSIDVPLTDFAGNPARANLTEFLISVASKIGRAYVDNIYFYKGTSGGTGPVANAPTELLTPPTRAAEDVISMIGLTNVTWDDPSMIASKIGRAYGLITYTDFNKWSDHAGGNGETSAGGTGPVANAPTDAPSTPPTRAAEDVISIYGEAYGTEIGLTNVTWDDPSQFTERR